MVMTLARLCDPAGVSFELKECYGGRRSPLSNKEIDARGWLQRIRRRLEPGQYFCASP